MAHVTTTQAEEILDKCFDAEVIGIDEAQFFDKDIVKVCQTLADAGKRVIVAGLDQDFRAVPFEPIPQLLAIAEYVTKTLAICVVCGNPGGEVTSTANAIGWARSSVTRPLMSSSVTTAPNQGQSPFCSRR